MIRSGKAGRERVRSDFDLGNVMAEADHLLAESFYDNGDYTRVASQVVRKSFVLGRTGSGKSAIFNQLKVDYPGRVIPIKPDDLALPYLTNTNVIDQLMEMNVRVEPFLVALWKHVFMVEIIKNRYQAKTADAQANVIQHLIQRLRRDHTKAKALRYFERYGEQFWCTSEERVRTEIDSLTTRVSSSDEFKLAIRNSGIGTAIDGEEEMTHQVSVEYVRKLQDIVSAEQIPQLNEVIRLINEEVLEEAHHFTYIVIDDLDRAVVDERLSNTLIKCLFTAIIELLDVKNLKILVAIRTNIFNQLDYERDIRPQQLEKIRGLIAPVKWRRVDLINLLERRLDAAKNYHHIHTDVSLGKFLPPHTRKIPEPIEVLLDHTLLRPRDAIALFNKVIQNQTGNTITWADFYRAEREYSRERLEALALEWADPYTDLKVVLNAFSGSAFRMSQEQMFSKIDDVVTIALAQGRFRGNQWLEDMTHEIWENGTNESDWRKARGRVLYMLYQTGFIGNLRRVDQSAPAEYIQDLTASPSPTICLDAKGYEVHLAFRSALEIKTPID